MPPESTLIFFALMIGVPPIVRMFREDAASARKREYFIMQDRLLDAERAARRRPQPTPAPVEEPTAEQIAHAITLWHEGRGRN